ncbi:MAG: MBL fold metallo-hydrolase [Bacteroidetes bacterium]|nr:MBL fold metallo-hydrolase [Bacteroidota bacterium]
MKLHVINTGLFKLDGGAMFGVVPKTMWNKLNPPDENNLCTWAMRCLLLEYDDRKVLIDTGIGNKQDEKFFSYFEPHGDDSLMNSISKLGLSAEDITDVFNTHFHFDHCGGAVIKEGEEFGPAFPNATYWTNKKQWEWALDPNPREKASFLKENIQPMQDAKELQFIETQDMIEVFPGFRVKFVYGHTEAMMIPHIDFNGKTVVYMADLIPSTAHVHLPFVMAYDVRPLQTLEEKGVFLQEAVDKDYVLFFEHDKNTECCTLQSDGRRTSVKDTMQLSEI